VRLAFFDTHPYERECFEAARTGAVGRAADGEPHEIVYFETRLSAQTARLASGFGGVCSFVNDRLDEAALTVLAEQGVHLVALRSAGFNHVDLAAAERLGLTVARVPEYSPHAVAEHAVALVLALDRKIHRAYARVREWNFSLDGLVGFDLHGRTVGIVGLGRIGRACARVFRGFGCTVLGVDAHQDAQLAAEVGLSYVPLDELYRRSDIISLHVPLTPQTHHLLDAQAFAQMKRGVMVINTGRGALIDSRALIEALKSGHVGHAGLDVYEEEEGIFFENLSDRVLQDDVLARLLTFPNVIVTSHQGFLTREALQRIAETTLLNATAFERGEPLANAVRSERLVRAP
jgi:D-lactate dehydrogenase